jgi:hypothetical protein
MVWSNGLSNGFITQIESKIPSALLGIGTVASDAVVRENRANIAIEIDGLRFFA